jgi:hypothetical protein
VRAISSVIDGVQVYGKFLDDALIDQEPKPMLVTEEGNSLILTLPHFWDYAAIDPGILTILTYKNIMN